MDLLVLVVVGLGAILGFWQGAFKQLANLLGTVVGVALAVLLYDRFGDVLSGYTGAAKGTANMLAFAIIVIVVPIALGLLASLLTRLFKVVHLGCLNRLAGAVIGALCYGFLLSFAFNVMDFAKSNGGSRRDKLGERTELFYLWKQGGQFAVPDVLIVTDSTEVAQGAEPRYGLLEKLPSALGGKEAGEADD